MKKNIALVFLIGGFAALVAVADFYHNAKTPESQATTKPEVDNTEVAQDKTPAPTCMPKVTPEPPTLQAAPKVSEKTTPSKPEPQTSLPETFGIIKLNLDNFLTLGNEQLNGPTSIYSLSGQRRDDGTACGMVITVMDLSKLSTDSAAPTLSLEQFLKVMFNGHRQKTTEIQASEIKDQKINNLDFKKISWQTTDNSHGFIYATRNGNKFIALTASDSSPYNQKSLPKCEKIIQSFTFNNTFKQAASK
jgi:hypothetical protein